MEYSVLMPQNILKEYSSSAIGMPPRGGPGGRHVSLGVLKICYKTLLWSGRGSIGGRAGGSRAAQPLGHG